MRFRRPPRPPAAEAPRFAALKAMDPAAQAEALAAPGAAAWIEAAARHGLVEAQVLLGQFLLDGRAASPLPGAAAAWFAAAAGAGHPPALNMHGRCLEHGWGVPADPAAAAGRYERAASAGLDWGQFNWARALHYGIGVPRDDAAARRWFGAAAAQGLGKAMNMLGRLHEAGWGGPADPAAAETWYRRAAETGEFRGQFNLATILARRGRRGEALALFAAALESGPADFRREAAAALYGSGDPALQALADRARTPSAAAGAGPYAQHAPEPPHLPRQPGDHAV